MQNIAIKCLPFNTLPLWQAAKKRSTDNVASGVENVANDNCKTSHIAIIDPSDKAIGVEIKNAFDAERHAVARLQRLYHMPEWKARWISELMGFGGRAA